MTLGLFLAGCSQQPAGQLSGVWRSEDATAAKNLVIEFVPGGTGKVFSGSIIGFPTNASFDWERKGDQVTIETRGDDPVTQVMTLVSQNENSLTFKVNRTEVTLVRIDDVIADDTESLLSNEEEDDLEL